MQEVLIVNMHLPAIFSGFITLLILSGSESADLDKSAEKNIIYKLIDEIQDLRINYAELKRRQDKTEQDTVFQDKKLKQLLIELDDLKTCYGELRKEQTKTIRELRSMRNKYGEPKHGHDKTLLELQEMSTMKNKDNKPLRQRMEQPKLTSTENLKSVAGSKTTLKSQLKSFFDSYFVGFTVRLSTSRQLGANQTIKFDSVVTNIGGGYDPTMGTFTCLYPGVYMFFSSILANPGKWMETEIVYGGNNVAIMYSADSKWYGSGSNMAVLNMEEGDRVWVRVFGNPRSSGNQIDGFGYSSFSGFRVA